jgi:hypothetical protein
VLNDFYKYYNNGSWWGNVVTLSDDTWKTLEFVSVNENDEVIGFLKADIQRPENYVNGLGILNFGHKANVTFSKDLHKFLHDLFDVFGYYKICFSVVCGNPIEKMYDKYVLKNGGHIVGTFKKDVMLHDGKLYDRKHYEIFKAETQEKELIAILQEQNPACCIVKPS